MYKDEHSPSTSNFYCNKYKLLISSSKIISLNVLDIPAMKSVINNGGITGNGIDILGLGNLN